MKNTKKIWNEAFYFGYFHGFMFGLFLALAIYWLLGAVK